MDQRPESPRTPPPFFNFSPDLKNYRAFLKSPNAVVDSDASKFALSEMDFESAYALLTTTPDFQIPTTPGANQLPPLGQEMDFKETFLPNKPPSPNVLPSVVPNWQFDIGQPSPKYHELLSVNETNALETSWIVSLTFQPGISRMVRPQQAIKGFSKQHFHRSRRKNRWHSRITLDLDWHFSNLWKHLMIQPMFLLHTSILMVANTLKHSHHRYLGLHSPLLRSRGRRGKTC
ncbi:uncharacterized protein CYBJADRAFT_168110 [Cyberlindnera jadinii NRRL Y-1542]|uniref:Uncharacterized protein n=1 Tax=Cyberlindnera jadinii (strain ATCC 18201 / CBS 1600 / BCRC 20928 / JCM 3617 / NBRC 0987 / NRRL Y-1542) TaxID=983966 RepID=A0A1E4S0M1_CYBJN|nr:hypothetical protein CYBJADRAFT_168110 [Cyberlindnera jadinii NRRL Y-1542]ODV73042.1 hypothetical protein CYBJADRAFT_168110 [Cyberlindnera jadinii NRRL Y-1542]